MDDPQSPDDGAMPDMGSLLGMAMEMQQQMLAAQQAATEAVVEGHAGGGVVRVTVNGAFEFQSVTIDPEAVDPDDVEMLQDLVLAAIHDAVARVHELTAAANPLAGFDLGGLGGMDLGGLDLGGIGGMLGLGGDAADGDDDPSGGVVEVAEVDPTPERPDGATSH